MSKRTKHVKRGSRSTNVFEKLPDPALFLPFTDSNLALAPKSQIYIYNTWDEVRGNITNLYKDWILDSLKNLDRVEVIGVDPAIPDVVSMILSISRLGSKRCRWKCLLRDNLQAASKQFSVFANRTNDKDLMQNHAKA
ncbi:hypothetical protein HK098_003767 [Nowakowskiella sp. JEL0407]|nr:hypothetical protein HK098_003767 [Nowakowskiella sp. JEL0407]